MFFMGVFGIAVTEEARPLGTVYEACPEPRLVRRCKFFHFFFVPLYRWNFEYFLQCRGAALLKLKKAAGERVWKSPREGIATRDVEEEQGMTTCPVCGRGLEADYSYCPGCGKKI